MIGVGVARHCTISGACHPHLDTVSQLCRANQTAANVPDSHSPMPRGPALPATAAGVVGPNARQLPWRRPKDPYAVWVSEIMLQQTQVATVVGYFGLAPADVSHDPCAGRAAEDEVLRLWEGLGYYRRARQLHRAAEDHRGASTAADFHATRKPRDVCRASAATRPVRSSRSPSMPGSRSWRPTRCGSGAGCWATAATRGRPRGSGALGDGRGAAAAARRRPFEPGIDGTGQPGLHAGGAAVRGLPRAAALPCEPAGPAVEIPRRAKRPPIEAVREAAVVVRKGGRVLLLRWPEGGRWAGLWDFPRFPLVGRTPSEVRRELVQNVRNLTGVHIAPGRRFHTLTHSVTRFRITLDCFEADCLSAAHAASAMESRWLCAAELEAYPLSGTGRKLTRLIR